MLQYLYAAYALKPAYAELVGAPAPGATSLMGIIIQEMQHLGDINRLLVELDAKPVLTRLDIPYETDVYPFPFELAPLSSVSLAKFTYCEADPVRLGHVRSINNDSVRLADMIKTSLGGSIAVNHVGKLYDAVVETLGEVKEAGKVKIDFGAWFQNIGDVKAEGEFGHFKFFHSLYEGAHPLIKDTPGIWDLPATDARYPSYNVPVNPTAYEGRPTTIKDPDLRALAWLGNLNYWSLLLLLDAGYRHKSKVETAFAQAIMMGPLHVDRAVFAGQGFGGAVRPAQHGVRSRPQRRIGKTSHAPDAGRDAQLRPIDRETAAWRLQSEDLRPVADRGVSMPRRTA